jgi:glycosyltransferase involved in cell wall biosynthesis
VWSINRFSISIIIPTYNRPELLCNAVESILFQKIDDVEIIVVNDGSTEDYSKFVEKYKEKIIYIEHDKNMGVSCAMNTGYSSAHGVFCAFLSDDDELLPRSLQTLRNILFDEKNIDIKSYRFDIWDEDSQKIEIHLDNEAKEIGEFDILRQFNVGDQWVVFNNEAASEYFPMDKKMVGSEVFIWLLLARDYRSIYLPKMLYLAHTKHDSRLSDGAINSDKMINYLLMNRRLYNQYENELYQVDVKKYEKIKTRLVIMESVIGSKANAFELLSRNIDKKIKIVDFIVLLIVIIPKPIYNFVLYYLYKIRFNIKTISALYPKL